MNMVEIDNPKSHSDALDLLHELKGGNDHLVGEVVKETASSVTVTFTATIDKDWIV